MSMDGLKYYVSPEIVGDMMDDMEVSIKELQTKKKDLEDQKKAMAKNIKGPKKSEDKEDLDESKLTTKQKNKKEDVVKSMKKSFKGPKSDMYAIATSVAKKSK